MSAREATETVELMARHGITRVPADRYHYKEWRYSNLDDAVAQARRDAASPHPDSRRSRT